MVIMMKNKNVILKRNKFISLSYQFHYLVKNFFYRIGELNTLLNKFWAWHIDGATNKKSI